jgi:elongation factor P--(R)-beta-lysine ligase
MLAQTRSFFAQRGVLEVDTPVLVNAPVTDVHIHSARVRLEGSDRDYFLHTSPEYAMKRLIAAGSGDIYQICHVVRGLERGRLHNAEFTLIEWYRLGFSLDDLMDEVDALVRTLLGPASATRTSERISYRDVFLRELQIDPLTASVDELANASRASGLDAEAGTTGAAEGWDRDAYLDFIMGAVIGPRLGRDRLTFVHGYPASQAALARLDVRDPRTALRFELYGEGIELANGFHELAASSEQRTRFESDNAQRKQRSLPTYAIDEHLLAALAHGLPDCTGVALGFDRVVMLATGAQGIDEVLPFPIERA